MKILGIDPGTQKVGFGLIETHNGSARALGFGVIKGKGELPQRLKTIYTELNRVLKWAKPHHIVIENTFYAKNVNSTIKMGEGRGVVLLCAAQSKAKIFEYTPAEVKKAVVGNGRADKSQVQKMVQMLMRLKKPIESEDASDALAIAICHVHRIT